MKFDKKYVYYFKGNYYIWFGEHNGETYFDISVQPVQECELMRISLNNTGYYDDLTYIWFGKGIYMVDEKNLTATQVTDNVYDVHFLENSILAMKMHSNRLDEMIKIIPYENKIISMGILQKENVLR